VTATEPDQYFGVNPGIGIVKTTNGHNNDPNFKLPVGAPVTWTYTVTNTGNVPLTNVQVTDNRPGVTPVYQSGDANTNGQLDLGETWIYTATGTAVEGAYTNVGTARGTDTTGTVPTPVTATEPDQYFGVRAAIQIVKLTNGTNNDTPPGIQVRVGSVVTWTYRVTNPGNVPLRNVTVTDDNGTPGNAADDFSATFVNGDANSNGLLDPGEVWIYTASGTAVEGQYGNVGKATGEDNTNTVPGPSKSENPDHYLGVVQPPIIVLGPEKNPGTPQHVKVIDSGTGEILAQFVAYEENYTGGTRVAVGDLDGDGTAEIITAPGRNRAPEIRVFDLDGNPVPAFPSFLAYDASFKGGVQLALADVNGDGRLDIITAPSYDVANVRVFLNQYPLNPPFQSTPDISFRAFTTVAIGGAVVAGADMGQWVGGAFVNVPDGKAEIVVATGGGTKATVSVFDVSGATPARVQTFFPFTAVNSNFQGGVSLDVARIDADAIPDIIAGMGTNGTSRIEVWAWNTATASLGMLGAIPGAFTGASNNAPVNVAAMDTNGDEIGDAIFAVQGPIGTTAEVHRFNITNTSPFAYQQADPLTGFPGPWFVATEKTLPSGLIEPPPVPGEPPPNNNWTNPTDPLDVNARGGVSPLDALVTINFINIRPGQTGLPPQQSDPPLYFDTSVDGLITAIDVLLVTNHMNSEAAGEGEMSETPDEIVMLANPLPALVSLAVPSSESSGQRVQVDEGLAVGDTPIVPADEWLWPPAEVKSPLVSASAESGLEDLDPFDLDAVLEEISPEIAAAGQL